MRDRRTGWTTGPHYYDHAIEPIVDGADDLALRPDDDADIDMSAPRRPPFDGAGREAAADDRRTKLCLSDADRDLIARRQARSRYRFTLVDGFAVVVSVAAVASIWKWIDNLEVFTALVGVACLVNLVLGTSLGVRRLLPIVLTGGLFTLYVALCLALVVVGR